MADVTQIADQVCELLSKKRVTFGETDAALLEPPPGLETPMYVISSLEKMMDEKHDMSKIMDDKHDMSNEAAFPWSRDTTVGSGSPETPETGSGSGSPPTCGEGEDEMAKSPAPANLASEVSKLLAAKLTAQCVPGNVEWGVPANLRPTNFCAWCGDARSSEHNFCTQCGVDFRLLD
mmetsp:Transcript_80869/g.142643  ORF Transcript_80869/g.142643 Transcript_80869/m.142643 type:complete len:177 (-) Transcript_80869:209-739(-)|eukprot:CAMPEP_0197650724 /NCGR_PEP_ID=MMETSP1338-20131121/31119_1 /TAXON_ID=43686 ORGANISM="Pelagodinium beii, Strain RCC1491" /NCGR_SAMPLE_ID=MMETSP1338 /ASSEMBLY_ACC=CAM_ASM_000754 /LENGTH=176 /DNA_ID=CAMNT_0043225191 /DNA_START=69 /DNA_END=599 /DNA_ORIENTATION=+